MEIFTLAWPQIQSNGLVHADLSARRPAFIVWWPSWRAAGGKPLHDGARCSLNDKWDYNNRLSFNVGARYTRTAA